MYYIFTAYIYCDDDAFIQIKQRVDMNHYKAQQTVASKYYCPVIQFTSCGTK